MVRPWRRPSRHSSSTARRETIDTPTPARQIPVLLYSALSGSDKLDRFTETGANMGSLGVFEAKYLIRLMQANARMFDKFGA